MCEHVLEYNILEDFNLSTYEDDEDMEVNKRWQKLNH